MPSPAVMSCPAVADLQDCWWQQPLPWQCIFVLLVITFSCATLCSGTDQLWAMMSKKSHLWSQLCFKLLILWGLLPSLLIQNQLYPEISFSEQIPFSTKEQQQHMDQVLHISGRKAQQCPTQLTPGFPVVLQKGWAALEKQSMIKPPCDLFLPL